MRALLAKAGGSITVERFMREALYHPDHGYYSRNVRTVGGRGDFSTSATLHRALGKAIAAWAVAHRAEVTRARRWHLIELGGGTGELAEQIRRALGWWAGLGLQYHIVELSDGLRRAQAGRLKGWRNVRWHLEIGTALEAAGGHALIYSNEFVDAFPCVVLTRDSATDRWREVCITWPGDSPHPVEVLREWCAPVVGADPFPASVLGRTLSFPPNQRVEMHYSYQRWLSDWMPHWETGRLLTVDYGDTLPELYHRRPRGTLRGYFQHQRFIGPEVYRRFGRQDLTADVNFTDLQNWGTAFGLITDRLSTQADFLERWLPPAWIDSSNRDPVLAYLLDPDGAGHAFKVLDQVRPPR